ncbi:MAG TPA: cytochrome C oxidase subunit IV family protein [Saprospiraceae bacterium]|nr:cytochrome C oxidase subunit IV family protein [Saprospiraceae bacterium]HND90073.1 cytochrome C oxidase subunit IV family protein [Saprospiraceae bacterium]
MAGHLSYEEQKQLVFRGLILLAVITIVEVVFALFAKGHISPSVTFGKDGGFGQIIYMIAMISASLYKAYFIIFFFMHMAHEVRGLVLSVLLPTILLVWAIIAFFQEGSSWGARRELIKEKNEQPAAPAPAGKKQGYILMDAYKG